MYPPTMLDNVYVRGSLKNNATGFELALRNNIDYGSLVGVGFVVADGTTYPPSALTLKVGTREMKGDEITYRAPLPVPVGSEVQLSVAGAPLAPGAHHLTLSVNEWQIGRLQFEVSDEIA